MASPPAETPLASLELALSTTAETLNSLALTAYDFSYDLQPTLISHTNQLVSDLRELDRAAGAVDAGVPMDVLEALDRGRNPELCTYDMLEDAAAASAAARGKLDCMETFRSAMEREMGKAGVEGIGEEALVELLAVQAVGTAGGEEGEKVEDGFGAEADAAAGADVGELKVL